MYNQRDLERLRLELLEKSGVASPEDKGFEQLSIAIFLSNEDYISVKTLQRVFGLLPNEPEPSIIILGMLSRYLGYADWDDFKGPELE